MEAGGSGRWAPDFPLLLNEGASRGAPCLIKASRHVCPSSTFAQPGFKVVLLIFRSREIWAFHGLCIQGSLSVGDVANQTIHKSKAAVRLEEEKVPWEPLFFRSKVVASAGARVAPSNVEVQRTAVPQGEGGGRHSEGGWHRQERGGGKLCRKRCPGAPRGHLSPLLNIPGQSEWSCYR